MAGTVLEDKYTFLIMSRSVLLRMIIFSDERCADNQDTHFVFHNFFFSKIMPFMR